MQLDAPDEARMVDRELLDADRIQPRRDRHALLPVRHLATVAERDLALSRPFATTMYLSGAVTMNSLVALADG